MITVSSDSPGSVTQLLPAASVEIRRPSSATFAREPLARVAPHGSPRDALRALGRAGARREFPQVRNHS